MTDLSNFGLSYINGRDISVDIVLLCSKTEFSILNNRKPTNSEIYKHFSLINNGAIIKE